MTTNLTTFERGARDATSPSPGPASATSSHPARRDLDGLERADYTGAPPPGGGAMDDAELVNTLAERLAARRADATPPPPDAVPAHVVGDGYCIRFVFEDAPPARRIMFAAPHPDPPHDYAMSEHLADAYRFDTYADAARVLDRRYGRADVVPTFNGSHGRVELIAEMARSLELVIAEYDLLGAIA